jgi:hypothetical protein
MKNKNWRSLFGVLFLPIFSFAQLDKISPGMSPGNFNQAFPHASVDMTGEKDKVSAKDTIYGTPGYAEYTFSRDTITRYTFSSISVPGPCKKFPGVDTIALSKLLDATRNLYNELSKKYGVPAEKYSTSLLFPKQTQFEISVFGAKWKVQNGLIIIKVKESGDPAPFAFANDIHYPKERGENCYYEMTVEAMTNSTHLYPTFNLGFSKNDFRKKYPALASSVKDTPEIWFAPDSVYGANGEWRGKFFKDKLILFSFNAYDGSNYQHDADEAYSIMCKRMIQLIAEGQKQFGNPDSASATLPVAYVAPSLQTSYFITHYYSRWKINGNFVVMKMEETGGGMSGPSTFHLSVYYEEK